MRFEWFCSHLCTQFEAFTRFLAGMTPDDVVIAIVRPENEVSKFPIGRRAREHPFVQRNFKTVTRGDLEIDGSGVVGGDHLGLPLSPDLNASSPRLSSSSADSNRDFRSLVR